jgi:hypothetical protein
LQEIANNHRTLRQMLGHGLLDNNFNYHRQTLNDNLRWFTPKVADEINQITVNAGMALWDEKDSEKKEHARCDSFVFETDVHFPTDINLLWDAVRKAMQLSYKMSEIFAIEGWRQTPHNLRKVKRQYRTVQRERDRDKNSNACISATQHYIDTAMEFLIKAEAVAETIIHDPLYGSVSEEIRKFTTYGRTQIDQIVRRCFENETIPHCEKIFSVFEPHTEWIQKGKAGVPQELGLRVCIMESSSGLILHHKVMQQQTDDAVAVEMVEETLKRFPHVHGVSFDKGFHSPQNQKDLAVLLEHPTLPRKGRLTAEVESKEQSDDFIEKRRRHSAVESAINALENHGLDRCCDCGIEGFERYVALAVLARNIQLLGAILRKRELDALERSRGKAA